MLLLTATEETENAQDAYECIIRFSLAAPKIIPERKLRAGMKEYFLLKREFKKTAVLHVSLMNQTSFQRYWER